MPLASSRAGRWFCISGVEAVGVDDDRALGQVRAGGQVQLMQPLRVAGASGFVAEIRVCDDVQHAARLIDHRRADDAHLAVDVQAAEVCAVQVGGRAEVDMPDRA